MWPWKRPYTSLGLSYGTLDLPTLQYFNQYVKLIFYQWSVRWCLSHELSKLWEKVGQCSLWCGREENQSQSNIIFFPKTFKNFTHQYIESGGIRPPCRVPEWRVGQLWVQTLRCHGAVVVTVIVSVIVFYWEWLFFFYCLRLLIPSSFKLKILPFESIMHKMVSSVQLWKPN